MTDPLTVADLQAFLDGVDGDRTVHFIGSGAIHDCVGADVEDLEWNTGDVEPAIVLGGHGSGVADPRSEE
jgi:hypothetical protein